MTEEELKSVLLPGAKLEAFKIDPNDPQFEKRIEECHRRQKAILKQKEVDWVKARNTLIAI